ncbi:PREDICTED: coiled-coil domain-containing protein 110 [Nipponia nippon]|uniref:coiled-coil domain-containing protein 110 n=1 Tax=Nipponia nippon TaxID=128390 RepID=UPI0005112FA5|nr:PREDICTED: coiled-coil domain-containing protein 110 [Nipponia nippon]
MRDQVKTSTPILRLSQRLFVHQAFVVVLTVLTGFSGILEDHKADILRTVSVAHTPTDGTNRQQNTMKKFPNNHTVGAEDPADPQTLEILQQQLESFKTFQQQTLEDINTVQSKICEILNKDIFEMRTPLRSSDKILMTSTPSDASLLMENPESLPSKRKVHHHQQPCSDEHVEANSNTGNFVSDINIPHRISLKTKATEKVDNSKDLCGNNRILTTKTDRKYGHLLSGTNLETEGLNAAHEKVILSESKHHIPFPKFGKEFHKIDNTNYPTKLLKQEFPKSVRNDLDLLANNTGKSGFLSREKLTNLKESAEIVTSLEESHIGLVPDKGLHFDQEFYEDSERANVCGGSPTTVDSEKAESQSKNVHQEFRTNYSEGDRFPVNSFSEMVKDKLLMLDNKEQLKKEKEQQQTTLNLTLLRPGNQKFSEIKVASEYDGKTEALQKSLKNSEHLQKTVHDLPNENLALKNKVEPLTLTIQSSKEKISKCNTQIKDLAEEKKSAQILLVKSQEDNKECIKEAKNFLRKCKELQNQKNILEEERNQLHNGNQHSIQTQHDFQIRNQKEEKVTAVTCERKRLSATQKFLQKECFKLQETNKKLKMEISQLTKENSSLEQELERNRNEMQRTKEKETTAKSELETHLQLMQTLEAKKLNLEMTLQECSDTKQILQKDFEKIQSDKAYTEKKLMTELRNAKADIDLLKSNLTSVIRECERLSTVVTNVTEENQLLKNKLQERRQDASKYEGDIRKLTEDCLLLEHLLWSTDMREMYYRLNSATCMRIIFISNAKLHL